MRTLAGWLAVGALCLGPRQSSRPVLAAPADGRSGPRAPACAGTDPKTIYAWFPARFGSWRTDGIQWDCLTHLCFRAVELTADGTLREPASDPPKEFVEAAHRHRVKVTVLAWVTRPEDSDGYLAKHPERAAQSLLAYVWKNHLDGV